jgi:hypothetical protein
MTSRFSLKYNNRKRLSHENGNLTLRNKIQKSQLYI